MPENADTGVDCRSAFGEAYRVAAGHRHLFCSTLSLSCSKKKNRPAGGFSLCRKMRIRESTAAPPLAKRTELPPSSQRQADVRRTSAFILFDSFRILLQKKPPCGRLFLEQDTGVEPAFTAWEAVVLPIYESCNCRGIIAKPHGNFNHFLSEVLLQSVCSHDTLKEKIREVKIPCI